MRAHQKSCLFYVTSCGSTAFIWLTLAPGMPVCQLPISDSIWNLSNKQPRRTTETSKKMFCLDWDTASTASVYDQIMPPSFSISCEIEVSCDLNNWQQGSSPVLIEYIFAWHNGYANVFRACSRLCFLFRGQENQSDNFSGIKELWAFMLYGSFCAKFCIVTEGNTVYSAPKHV